MSGTDLGVLYSQLEARQVVALLIDATTGDPRLIDSAQVPATRCPVLTYERTALSSYVPAMRCTVLPYGVGARQRPVLTCYGAYGLLSAYALALRCAVAAYTMSGTDLCYGLTRSLQLYKY
eukprot:1582849-Rhodomonas_salina.1